MVLSNMSSSLQSLVTNQALLSTQQQVLSERQDSFQLHLSDPIENLANRVEVIERSESPRLANPDPAGYLGLSSVDRRSALPLRFTHQSLQEPA